MNHLNITHSRFSEKSVFKNSFPEVLPGEICRQNP